MALVRKRRLGIDVISREWETAWRSDRDSGARDYFGGGSIDYSRWLLGAECDIGSERW